MSKGSAADSGFAENEAGVYVDAERGCVLYAAISAAATITARVKQMVSKEYFAVFRIHGVRMYRVLILMAQSAFLDPPKCESSPRALNR